MARVSSIVTNFQAGELSPRLEGRIDLQKYSAGAQTLQNMLVYPQGGITRRPGTYYSGTSKDGGKVRLINFEFSDEQAYVLEFGANYVRFFKDGAILTEATKTITAITKANPAVVTSNGHGFSDGDRVFIKDVVGMVEVNNREFTVTSSTTNTFALSGVNSSAFTTYSSAGTAGKIVEVTTTYTVTEIFEINHVQSADVLYLAHKSHAPAKLTRTTTTSFTIDDIDFFDGPYLDENITDTSIFATGDSAEVHLVAPNINSLTVTETTSGITDTRSEVQSVAGFTDLEVSELKDKTLFFNDGTTSLEVEITSKPADLDAVVTLITSATGYGSMGFTVSAGTDALTLTFASSLGNVALATVGFLTDDVFPSGVSGALWRFREPVEQYHDEWSASKTNYAADAVVYFNGNVYKQTTGSTQAPGNTPPVHLEGAQTYNSGVIEWTFQHSGTGFVKITERNKQIGIKSKSGTYTLGETVTGGTSSATGEYVHDDGITMFLTAVTGTFQSAETLTGGSSSATSTSTSTISTASKSVKVSVKGVGVLPNEIVGLANASKNWSEGSFSTKNKFPKAVSFYEERLYFAGTEKQPQTIFGSVTADFENHTPGTEDDSAINVTIASDQVNVIKHMLPGRFLQIMTTSAEFTLSGSGVTAVTPTNVNVLRETTFGSGDVRPLRAGASTIMIQKGGEKVKEVTFSLETDGLVGRDLTVLGEHLARGGLTDMIWQQEPELLLWFVRGDGTLIGLSYDPANNTIGWHQHPLGGSGVVESITAIPSGSEDQVYLSVKRTINSSTVRHIVYMKSIYFNQDVGDACYVDSGFTYDSTATTTITGLDHLEGETIQILADGSTHSDKTVSNGSITLDRSASKVHVGYSYDSLVETLRLEAGAEDGVAQGKIKRIHGVTVRFLDTVGAELGPDTNNLDRLPFRDSSMAMDSAIPLFNGDKEIFFPSGYENNAHVVIRQNQPLPITIVAIIRRSNTFDA